MLLTDRDRAIARRTHAEFAALPGAEHIATEFALAHLSGLLTETRPRRVLEIGAGIGTITRLLLDHPTGVELVVSTEENEFCLGALSYNIGQETSRWKLVSSAAEAPPLDYDLVIFDGIHGSTDAFPLLGNGTVCFVEGIRQTTREALINYLSRKGLACTFRSYVRPSRLRFSRSRRWLGLIPKVKFRTRKGCHIGSVAPIAR